MLDGLTPDLVPRLILAIGGVGVAFVVLVLVLIFLKRRNSPLFIKGGKAREPRLMVLDAAAVDPKRRLVLIRRDDVEHLIMIGGPTDIVIETGIADRAAGALPGRTASVDEMTARAVAIPAQETRPAAEERRPEAARAAPAAQPEIRAAAPVVQPVAQPVSQPIQRANPVLNAPERAAERASSERLVEPSQTVSAMGSVLYGEDREPMTGRRGAAVTAGNPVTPPVMAAQPQQITQQPRQVEAHPSAAAAAALDAARDRVMPNQQTTPAAQPVTVADAERALAARMETMRRVQSAQPAVQPAAQPSVAAQPVARPPEASVEAQRAKDAEPSDFEKLLEAELDANGVFERGAPEVRSDARVTAAAAASTSVPPVRVSPPITGATPDLTSEEEVARLLGEIAINRKP